MSIKGKIALWFEYILRLSFWSGNISETMSMAGPSDLVEIGDSLLLRPSFKIPAPYADTRGG
jgi:hypothetical protein